MKNRPIKIIGAGLAGCEAALQLVKLGWEVDLYEMRPLKTTPAHETGLFAELVCSNSFKSMLLKTAAGLLKEELRLLDCELLKIAERQSLPAGNALAVDRAAFSLEVTQRIEQNPKIRVIKQEVTEIGEETTIIASGPLTSDKLTESLQRIIGADNLFFYDAIAPIIAADSIDLTKAYYKARYDKGNADYLNCPFTKTQYETFVESLSKSEKFIGKEFEREFFNGMKGKDKLQFYENCTPIEELVRRGKDTLRFGVMRPVGLENPLTQERPYAVIQLRIENKNKTAYNLVGCQTMMTQASQREVFRLIPGLEKAVFYRYGAIHRNTYLNSPGILDSNLSLKMKKNVYVAGQLSGVEGYVESIASGLIVSHIIADSFQQLPPETMLSQLWSSITNPSVEKLFPQNANYGLIPPLEKNEKDKQKKKQMLAERSIAALKSFLNQ